MFIYVFVCIHVYICVYIYVHIHVHMYVYVCIYIYSGIMINVHQLPGRIIPKTQKWHLMPSCLTLNIVRYGSRVSRAIQRNK